MKYWCVLLIAALMACESLPKVGENYEFPRPEPPAPGASGN